MAAIYRTQNRATLIQISNDLVTNMSEANPIFNIFPIVKRNHLRLRWRIQDNFKGVMKLRGAGGEPTRINPVGEKVYEETPGVFGEFSTIDEIELMERGRGIPQDTTITVDLKDSVLERQTQLLERQMNRLRQMGWVGALTGTMNIPLPGGGIGLSMSYTPLTYTPAVLWTTPGTSKPLNDFQTRQVAHGRGTSNTFGRNATAYMNSYTLQLMLNNTNANDWGGKKSIGGGSIQGQGAYNVLRMDMDTPALVIHDDGYLDDNGAFQLDIPDGKILVVAGRSNGEKPGEFQMTYNAVSKAPGAYAEVHDFTQGDAKKIPPRIDVHAGFNGGQVITRPTQLLVMTVA